MKKIILILAIVVLIIFLTTRNNETEEMQNEDAVLEVTTQEEVAGDSMVVENDVQEQEASEDTEKTSGGYEVYSADKVTFAENGDVVIFFRASWCPSCKILDESLKANLMNIPENLLILDANYDTETALKQKYGVTTQHTLVQVDAEGNMIQKWSGGSTLASIVSQI